MGSLVTQAGLSDIATASFLHETCNWNRIAVGDGGGSTYVPTVDQRTLKGQQWIGEVDNYTATTPTQGVFQAHIPTEVGGFVIREIGIFNEDDELVAVGVVEDQVKVALSAQNDHYTDMLINFYIAVDHADSIKVQVDPYAAVASHQYVNDTIDEKIELFAESIQSYLELQEADKEDIEEAFELQGGDPSEYPMDWEEATDADIDSLFN